MISSRSVVDPLIHYGRHFGRTVHALCNIHALINNGILRLGDLADHPEESFSAEYRLSKPVNRPTFVLMFDAGRGMSTKYS